LAIPLSAVAGLLLALGLAWRMVELPPEVGLTQPPPRSGLVRPAPAPVTTPKDAADAAPPAMSARPSAPAAVSQSREFREAAKAENAIEPLPTEALDTLQAIRQLVLQGDREAAIEQLAAFRRAHPHYPLPPDLAGLAKTE
jgi:predicted component of type VI protein secretion system